MVHWQLLASVLLLGGGVAGLAATYDNYCHVTELTYAPDEVLGDLERGSAVAGYRSGILAAQLETESHWQVSAISNQKAAGIAQFTDATWEQWGNGGDRANPHDAISAQSRYLGWLKEHMSRYTDNEDELLDLVLAGYNAGPGAVEKYNGVPPYPETQNYIKQIRKLSNTKYKSTCTPETRFRKSKITQG